MRNDQAKAFRLRLAGKSYREISIALSIPKSTLSAWLKEDVDSQRVKRNLLNPKSEKAIERNRKFAEATRERWALWREDARSEARKEFILLSNNHLFVAGIMLYWGEGDSNPKNPARFANTDPRMAALYVKFLISILKIPRENIRIALTLYPDLNDIVCEKFWSTQLDIPREQFYKTQFIKGRHPTKRLLYGVCSVICNSRWLKEKILVWIDLLAHSL